MGTAGLLFGLFTLGGTTIGGQAVAGAPGRAPTPIGWADLCRREPTMCRHINRNTMPPELTPARRAELDDVNLTVNRTFKAVTDQDQYGREEFWTIPDNKVGDCEDLALAKRQRLMQLGWSRSALLMTVAILPNGQYHAILTVETATGPLVLDNLSDRVVTPETTGYRFVSRQAEANPNRWVLWTIPQPTLMAQARPAPADSSDRQAVSQDRQASAQIRQ